MKAIIDSLNTVVYKYEGEGQYPSCLAEEKDIFNGLSNGVGEYKHIDIPDGAIKLFWLKVKWDANTGTFMDDTPPASASLPPRLSMDPSTDGSNALVKENENLKQRLIEQERQLNLIKSHLGL